MAKFSPSFGRGPELSPVPRWGSGLDARYARAARLPSDPIMA